MRSFLLLLSTLLLVACHVPRHDEMLRVELSVVADGKPGAGACVATIGSRSFDAPDSDALAAFLKSYGERHVDVHLVGATDVPYRCVGTLIYTMQRQGFGKIGFISEMPGSEAVAKER